MSARQRQMAVVSKNANTVQRVVETMRNALVAFLVMSFASCAPSLYQPSLYEQWNEQINQLTRQASRVEDVSLLLGSPPTRCDAVTPSVPSIGAIVESKDTYGLVLSVIPGGPAAQAGLRPGDKITRIAGQITSNPEQGRTLYRTHARDGQPLELGTDRGNVTVIPTMPKKVEQCYWDVQAGSVSTSGAYLGPSGGYAGGSASQRFFRSSCRVSDGFLTRCQSNWQQ